MASGIFIGGTQAGGYRLEVEWASAKDIANNRSSVSANVYWCSLGSGYPVYASATKYGSVTIDGSVENFSTAGANLSGGQRKLIKSWSKIVTHNSDGKRQVGISASYSPKFSASSYVNTVTAGGTATLDTIPRASTLSVDANWTAGSDKNISIARASTGFTHTVKIYVNSVLIKTITSVGDNVSSAFSVAQNTEIFNQLNAKATEDTKIEILTYSGGTHIGTTSKTGTVTAPSASTLNSPREFNIGSTFIVPIVRHNTGFTHTVRLKNGSTVLKTYSTQSTSCSFDTTSIATTLYNATPSSNELALTIECLTYYGAELVRSATSNDIKAKVTNSNPTFGSTYTYKDSNTTTATLTGNNQYIIQGKSNLIVEIPTTAKATSKNGATMSKYSVTVNGVSKEAVYSSTSTVSIDFGTVSVGANTNIVVSAIDSRGNATPTSKTITVIPYAPPVVIANSLRVNGFEASTKVSLNGSLSTLAVGGVNKNSMVSAKYKYKESTASTYGTAYNFTKSGFPNYTATDVTLTLDNMKAWDIHIEVTDKISTTTIVKKVYVGQPIFFMDSDMKSVSMNMFPTDNYEFAINGSLMVQNQPMYHIMNVSEGVQYGMAQAYDNTSKVYYNAPYTQAGFKLDRLFGYDFNVGKWYVNHDFHVGGDLDIGGKSALAVESSGSNSNGRYVRYTDGLQICWMKISTTEQTISYPYMGIYVDNRTWTYPIGFSVSPTVTCSQFSWGNSGSWGSVYTSNANSCTLRGYDFASRATGTTTEISAMAVGRWK